MSKKSSQMLVSSDRHETRVAIIEDGKLMEIYVQSQEKKSIVGNIYLGVVKDILPGIEATFVDIGLEKNAFLYVQEVATFEDVSTPPRIEHLLKRGQDILIQIVKEPLKGKGARVTTQITIPGRFMVLMPYSSNTVGISRKISDKEKERLRKICEKIKPKNMGIIVRTAAEGASEEELSRDLRQLKRLWWYLNFKIKRSKPVKLIHEEPELDLKAVRDWFSEDFERLIIDSKLNYNKIVSYLRKVSPELVKRVSYYDSNFPLFDKYEVNEQIKKVLRRKAWLKSGGYIAIDHTEALTAIDVNTGKFVGKKSLKQTVLKTNLEACKEVVRQIRLRDIGGIIVVDFIDMDDQKDRDKVFNAFNKELATDRIKSRVIDISKIGLVEMTRKNTSESLIRQLSKTCHICGGSGLIMSDKTVAIEVERAMRKVAKTKPSKAFLFKINPNIDMHFKEQLTSNLKTDTKKIIYIVGDPNLAFNQVELAAEGSPRSVEQAYELSENK
ncbi:MAG: Rne/Rng family ribonuclease [Actinobacteria bacterium]|nr:MAG: Rne/Rng family ribonuclease [Actinomycetota bacterium]